MSNARPPRSEQASRLEQAAYDAVKREIAASPEQFFKQRLELIEASLDELLNEVSAHNADLSARIETVSGATTRQTDLMAAKIVVAQKAIQELQILVYGKPEYRMDGLATEVKQMLAVLGVMNVDRYRLRYLVRILAFIVALTFIATLVGILFK